MLCAGVKNGSLNQHQLCSKHWGSERKCTAMIHSAFIFKKNNNNKKNSTYEGDCSRRLTVLRALESKYEFPCCQPHQTPYQHSSIIFIFFKKAYEQLVEEHFSPQLMFRPAVLAQCLTWDHMQSCLEVCMLLCLIRSVWWLQMWCISKKTQTKTSSCCAAGRC